MHMRPSTRLRFIRKYNMVRYRYSLFSIIYSKYLLTSVPIVTYADFEDFIFLCSQVYCKQIVRNYEGRYTINKYDAYEFVREIYVGKERSSTCDYHVPLI